MISILMNFRAINFRPFGILCGVSSAKGYYYCGFFAIDGRDDDGCGGGDGGSSGGGSGGGSDDSGAVFPLSPLSISSSLKRLFHFYLILLERLSFRS